MKDENVENLVSRTKQFAVRVIRLYSSFSKDAVSQVIGKQLLRSGTSLVRIIAKLFGLKSVVSGYKVAYF